jgi:hypothetical protein
MRIVKRAVRVSRMNSEWYSQQRRPPRENKKNDKQTEEPGQTD